MLVSRVFFSGRKAEIAHCLPHSMGLSEAGKYFSINIRHRRSMSSEFAEKRESFSPA
jgi:hypothetical protein